MASASGQRGGTEFLHVAGEGDEFRSVRGQDIGNGGVQTRWTRVSYGAEMGGGDVLSQERRE